MRSLSLVRVSAPSFYVGEIRIGFGKDSVLGLLGLDLYAVCVLLGYIRPSTLTIIPPNQFSNIVVR